MRAIALIGARAGSERVPGKNIRRLAGHPLLAYAIATAQQAGVFDVEVQLVHPVAAVIVEDDREVSAQNKIPWIKVDSGRVCRGLKRSSVGK